MSRDTDVRKSEDYLLNSLHLVGPRDQSQMIRLGRCYRGNTALTEQGPRTGTHSVEQTGHRLQRSSSLCLPHPGIEDVNHQGQAKE